MFVLDSVICFGLVMDWVMFVGVVLESGPFEQVVLGLVVFVVAMAGVVWVLIEQVVQLGGFQLVCVEFEGSRQLLCPVPWCWIPFSLTESCTARYISDASNWMTTNNLYGISNDYDALSILA